MSIRHYVVNRPAMFLCVYSWCVSVVRLKMFRKYSIVHVLILYKIIIPSDFFILVLGTGALIVFDEFIIVIA